MYITLDFLDASEKHRDFQIRKSVAKWSGSPGEAQGRPGGDPGVRHHSKLANSAAELGKQGPDLRIFSCRMDIIL